MSIDTLYNLNYSSPTQITREAYSSVGASAFIMGTTRRGFKGSTDFEIWDSVIAGTQLTETTDYTLDGIDAVATAAAGFNVYTTVTIVNAAYQAVDLWFTYKTIGTYPDADDMNDLRTDVATNTVNIASNTAETLAIGVYRNAIINGSMEVSQRGATFTPDDLDYTLDRCQCISDGDGIVDHDQVDEGSGEFSLKMTVNTLNKKFGYVQCIENKDAEKFQGRYVSLRFEAKTTAGKVINNVRAAVLSFTGTADSPGDPVSAWNAAGSDPTWSANYTAENTPANIAITTTYDTYKVENIYMDTASINNISVVIWCDDDDAAAGDELFIKNVQLNLGSTALPFQYESFSESLDKCLRYTWVANAEANAGKKFCVGYWSSTTIGVLVLNHKKIMRTAPTVSFSDPSHFAITRTVSSIATTAISSSSETKESVYIAATVAAGGAAGEGTRLSSSSTSARIYIDAEL